MNIYILALLLILKFSFRPSPEPPRCRPVEKKEITATSNIVFRSADGGRTWRDISQGLPNPANADYVVGRNVSSDDGGGFYLTAVNGLYHGKPDSKGTLWTKETFSDIHFGTSPGNNRIFAYNYWGGILEKTNRSAVWSPVFKNFKEGRIRTVLESAGGTIFIVTDKGLFRSASGGESWKHIPGAGGVNTLAESNGIILATSNRGIIRSTNDGETWALVFSEGGVGIDVEKINGGFAAITFNTRSNTRRIRTSYDGGKTWEPIDAGLQSQCNKNSIWQSTSFGLAPQSSIDLNRRRADNDLPPAAFISSIVQVGDNFFCGHPAGIFKSSDKGATWELVLPSLKDKVFNLSVAGGVIYAIPRAEGC